MTDKKKTDQDPEADTDTAVDDGDGGEATDWEADARKWKALARKHEAEAKKNRTAAERVAELEDADKSEIQRERDKAAAADARAKTAETKAARLEVAVAKGLSPSLAARLVGDTREELEADAEELLAQLKPSGGNGGSEGDGGGTKGSASGDSRARPKESLRSGSAPDAEAEENDPKKLAEMIPRG